MPVDRPESLENNADRSTLPFLSLVFAALTIVCALLALALNIHIGRLYQGSIDAVQQQTASETASMAELKLAIDTAATDLDATRTALEKEKAATTRLSRQLAEATKAMDLAKAQLIDANKRLDAAKKAVRPSLPAPAPAGEAATPAAPAPTAQGGDDRSRNDAPTIPAPPATQRQADAQPVETTPPVSEQPAAAPDAVPGSPGD